MAVKLKFNKFYSLHFDLFGEKCYFQQYGSPQHVEGKNNWRRIMTETYKSVKHEVPFKINLSVSSIILSTSFIIFKFYIFYETVLLVL